ncbi:MAG TPA: hypothetical protein VFW71_13485 [Actinomycetota bacterium]|nr:hypothetical protein [Actinomycetota bacterium]
MNERRVPRSAAILMAAEAASLAVMSTLHLSGVVGGGTPPYRPSAAGIAEAVIGAVLAVGAGAGWRAPARSWAGVVAAVGFAIAGFLVGVTITISGGPAIDIAYHCTVLPVLVLTLFLLLRRTRRAVSPRPAAAWRSSSTP